MTALQQQLNTSFQDFVTTKLIDLIARSAYYFRSGPFEEIRVCVCVFVSNFRDFTEAENACGRVLLSHGTLPGKTSALLFGSEKFPQLMTV